MDTEFIYLQTLQHTGTWFVIGFLCDHPEVGGVVIEDNLFDGLAGNLDKHHLNLTKDKRAVPETLVPGKKNLLFGHVACRSHDAVPRLCPRQQAIALTSTRPVVVPLRDPLLAMITHEDRIPDFVHVRLHHKITTWRKYFEFLAGYEKFRKPVYLPIDVLTTDQRFPALKQMQAAYGLEDEELALKWSEAWPVYNSLVDQQHVAKQAYARRDLSWFEKVMPQVMKALKDSQDVLRPILERWYCDLLWWS